MKKLLYLLLLLTILLTCDLPFGTDEKEEETGFDIAKDIIEIPSSLLPAASRSVSRSASNTSEAAAIYDLIPEYINSAENIRSMVEEIVVDLIENKEWLDDIERDIPQEVTGDENIAEYIVTDITGTYTTRITLNSEAGSTTPMMVIDFYIAPDSDKTKGKIYLQDVDTYNGTPTGVTLEKNWSAEVTFDGTSDTKSLNIYYYQTMGDIESNDTTTLIGYARSLDGTVDANKTILNNLDLGQPERISIKITFDGEYYRASGYSYHPGLDTMHDKDIDVFYELFNPEDQSQRHTYLFKGIAGADTDGTDIGAKLYLSFPIDTLTDTSNVWVDDALGEFYADYLTTVANSYINDPDEDGTSLENSEYGKALFMNIWINNKLPSYTTGDSVDETKWGELVKWINAIKTGIVDAADLATANSYITGLEYKSEARSVVKRDDIFLLAEMFEVTIANGSSPLDDTNWESFKTNFNSDIVNLASLTYGQVNSYLNETGNSDSDKEGVIFLYELTTIIDELVPTTFSSFTLTRSVLETFLARDDLDSGAQSFAALYKSLNYIVNPALYHSSDKFLGTYNFDTQEYYQLSGSSLELTTSPTSDMTAINGYDGSSVDTLVPNTEKSYSISFP